MHPDFPAVSPRDSGFGPKQNILTSIGRTIVKVGGNIRNSSSSCPVFPVCPYEVAYWDTSVSNETSQHLLDRIGLEVGTNIQDSLTTYIFMAFLQWHCEVGT